MALLDYFLTMKFMQAGRVKGESTCKGFEDDIIIESFHWGAKYPENVTAAQVKADRNAYALVVENFKFKMKANKASPVLMQACWQMDVYLEAILKCCRDTSMGKQEYMRWTLNTGTVTSYEMAGTTEEVMPVDRFSISFNKVSLDYKPLTFDRLLGPALTGAIDLERGPIG